MKLTELIEEACNISMPQGTYKYGKKPSHWWTQEISNLRKASLKARRALHRARPSEDPEKCQQLKTSYKEARKMLKLAIKKSKEASWKRLCNQVETDPWELPYKMQA